VECDGDEFTSTPEQARADMERERELRRCGWRFWRVRESEYLLNPGHALDGLWDELEKRGVRPDSVGPDLAGGPVDDPWEPLALTRGD
jgi:very-short-patch-repair endonuclease